MPDVEDIVIEMSPDGSYDCTPEAFRRLAMKGQKVGLKRGQKVMIKGLKSKPELNGQTAVVKSFSHDKGRYTVAIDKSGQSLALKEANLEKITPMMAQALYNAEREQAIEKAKAKRAEVEKAVAKAKAEANANEEAAKARVEAAAKAEEEKHKKQSANNSGLGKGFDEDGEFHEASLMNSDDEDDKPEPAVEPAPETPTKKKKKKTKKKKMDEPGLEHKVTITDTAVVIAIELSATSVTSMAELSLDVFEEKLNLHQISTNKLLLAVPLTEKVDPDAAAAKFSKKKRRLTVTVPKL